MELNDLRIGDTIRYQVLAGEIAEGVIQELYAENVGSYAVLDQAQIEIKSVQTGLLGLIRLCEVIEITVMQSERK